ncbi:MAG: Type secretion system domain protein [Blastococcus sp.]|nr:Type secretion system domain protein [Blastococcus sp.]
MSGDRPWPAVLALLAALLLWSPGRAVVVLRLRGLFPPGAASAADVSEDPGRARDPRRARVVAGAAGLAAGLLVGGGAGIGVGAGVAVAGVRVLRMAEPDDQRAARAALVRDLPGACDLLGVCLGAGLPVAGALAAVGEAVPGPLGSRLQAVAALYRLGAEPGRAWADAPAPLAALGRTMVRAGESGASVVPALVALASDTRSSARALVEADVRRAGVWVLAPLGLCFLPAFVCLGVVPLVLGIAGDVLG